MKTSLYREVLFSISICCEMYCTQTESQFMEYLMCSTRLIREYVVIEVSGRNQYLGKLDIDVDKSSIPISFITLYHA